MVAEKIMLTMAVGQDSLQMLRQPIPELGSDGAGVRYVTVVLRGPVDYGAHRVIRITIYGLADSNPIIESLNHKES